jgi:protein-S-isoprenylcysteine O-methyltransferase Ste14
MKIKSRYLPPTYFFILLFLSIALHFLFPATKVVFPPYTYSGFLLIVFGIVLNLWADFLLKKGRTTVKPYEKPTKLITSGPFRISRNPQYLGFAAILLGVAVNHGTLVTFVAPVAFVILMELMFIPFEEENLKRNFGKRFLDYRKRVRRWI